MFSENCVEPRVCALIQMWEWKEARYCLCSWHIFLRFSKKLPWICFSSIRKTVLSVWTRGMRRHVMKLRRNFLVWGFCLFVSSISVLRLSSLEHDIKSAEHFLFAITSHSFLHMPNISYSWNHYFIIFYQIKLIWYLNKIGKCPVNIRGGIMSRLYENFWSALISRYFQPLKFAQVLGGFSILT